MTISEAFELYRDDVIVYRNQSPKTEENHLIAGRNLAAFTNDMKVRDLTFPIVRDWKLHLEKKTPIP